MKKFLTYTLLTSLLLTQSGCFTAMDQFDHSFNGDDGISPGAVALDIITAPIQIPIFAGIGVVALVDQIKEKPHKDLLKRLRTDAEYRNQLLHSPDHKKFPYIFRSDILELLTEEEFQQLWEFTKEKDEDPYYRWMLSSKRMSSEMLDEFYAILIEKNPETPTEGNSILVSSLSWVYRQLLIHPNLSPELIEELRAYNEPEIDKVLDMRQQYQWD